MVMIWILDTPFESRNMITTSIFEDLQVNLNDTMIELSATGSDLWLLMLCSKKMPRLCTPSPWQIFLHELLVRMHFPCKKYYTYINSCNTSNAIEGYSKRVSKIVTCLWIKNTDCMSRVMVCSLFYDQVCTGESAKRIAAVAILEIGMSTCIFN